MRPEKKQAHNLIKAALVEIEPSGDLVKVLGPAVSKHSLDLVGEEELFTDKRRAGERYAMRRFSLSKSFWR